MKSINGRMSNSLLKKDEKREMFQGFIDDLHRLQQQWVQLPNPSAMGEEKSSHCTLRPSTSLGNKVDR